MANACGLKVVAACSSDESQERDGGRRESPRKRERKLGGEREKIWKREKERKRWTKEGGKVAGVANHGLLVSRKKGAEKRKIGSRGKRRRKEKKRKKVKKKKKRKSGWVGTTHVASSL